MDTIRRFVISAAVIHKQSLRKYVGEKNVTIRLGHPSRYRFSSVDTTKNSSEDNNIKPWQEIPGPSSLPLIGQLHYFFPGGSLYGQTNEKLAGFLHKTYGAIVKLLGHFGSTPMIYLYDADSAMHIFRNENTLPYRPRFQSLEYFRKIHNKNSDDIKSTGLLTE